jgi:spermidine/putrescine transport system substrate-binding protein
MDREHPGEGSSGTRPRPTDAERILAGIQRRPLSRRRFLQVAGIGSAAAWLAACSKKSNGSAGSTSAAPAASGELEDKLVVYNWANYLNPDSVADFEQTYGVTVQATDFYESNEEMIAKLQGGATGYDLVAPTGGYIEAMAQEGLLLKLDHSRLSNLSNVDARFLGFQWDPNNDYHAPKDWGTTGFGFLSDKVSEDLTSWADFYGVAHEYSGKYTVLDSMYEVIGSALKKNGFGYNSADQGEIDKALEDLTARKPSIGSITSTDYRQLMSRGDAWVSLGWNGDFFFVLTDQPSVKYRIPTEGTEYWVDTWAIPASAPHPNLAHEFINWILTAEHQGRESNFTYYASCVTGAAGFTDPAVAGDTSIYPPSDVIDKLEQAKVTPEVLEVRQTAWDKFLAS